MEVFMQAIELALTHLFEGIGYFVVELPAKMWSLYPNSCGCLLILVLLIMLIFSKCMSENYKS